MWSVNPLLHSIQLKGTMRNSVGRDQTPENLVPSHKIILFSFLIHSGAWQKTHSSPLNLVRLKALIHTKTDNVRNNENLAQCHVTKKQCSLFDQY